jgi:hypothetical protein
MLQQQLLGFGVGDDHRLRVAGQDFRKYAAVVLLGVLDNDIVEMRNSVQLAHQDAQLAGINRVDKRCLLAAMHDVRIVRRALRQRNQRIEQFAVPVDGSRQTDTWNNRTWIHANLLWLAGGMLHTA